MTEHEVQDGGMLLVPTTGEMVDAADPAACVRVLSEIRELEGKLKELKTELTLALAVEFSRQGTKTLEFGDKKAVLTGGTEIVWDIEVLEELRDIGLPEDRMNDLVIAEVSYKVNALVAKQLASANPLYRSVIERARREVPKAAYVSIRRG